MIKRDSLLTGILTGVFAPALTFLGYYLLKFTHVNLGDFFMNIVQLKLLSPVISLCLTANLLTFFIYIWMKADHSARGVLMATFFYGAIIVYLIFLR